MPDTKIIVPALFDSHSSVIAKHGYCPAQQSLFLQFPSGNVYRYPEFSTDAYATFLAAESKGRHLVQVIQKNYTGVPVPKAQPEAEQAGAG